jgi:lipoate-protein ligase A
MPEVRLLPYAVAGAAANMAADETLLESAAAGVASFRLYGWTEPTLSLGYFQASAAARAEPRLAALPWVRRASGGAALVHHREITYALALPPGPPWQPRCACWLRQMHVILQAALASCGVAARLCPPQEAHKRGEILCFLHQTPDDLLVGGVKVAGSAQRKQRGALLQHGGLLLAASPATPELPGIAELAGVRLSEDAVRGAILDRLESRTGWRLLPGGWTDAEERRRGELAAAKYARPAWNAKR